jgi:hypothetical protein
MIVSRYFPKLCAGLNVSNSQKHNVCLYKITHKIMGFVLFGIVFIWYLASVKQTNTH